VRCMPAHLKRGDAERVHLVHEPLEVDHIVGQPHVELGLDISCAASGRSGAFMPYGASEDSPASFAFSLRQPTSRAKNSDGKDRAARNRGADSAVIPVALMPCV
jgi:hypothetical protein